MSKTNHEYWVKNRRLVGLLLSIWFLVSLVFGSLLSDTLDSFRIPGTGFKLGFWFGHQGSIIIFVILIIVYARQMNRLDREYGFEEEG